MPIPANQQEHVEIIVRGQITSGGGRAVPTFNVFHYRRTVLTSAVNKAAVDTAFQAAIGVPIIAVLNNRWSQLFNTVRVLNDVQDQVLQTAHVNAGGVAGDGLSTILAAYVLMRTTLRKGSFRGAKRFGPLSEADSTALGDDILNAGAIARFATLNAAMLAGFTDSTGKIWVPVIVSRKNSQLKTNATTVVATDVASILLNKRVGRLKVREIGPVY